MLVVACGDNSSPGDWQRVEATALDGISFEAVWGVGDDVWAAGPIYDLPLTAVVHFDGDSWDALPYVPVAPISYLPLPIRSLWATSPDDVWVAAGRLAHWNGHSWRISSPLGGEVQFSHIWASSAEDTWAVVEGPEGSVHQVAHSSGAGWTIVPDVPLDDPTSGCSNASDDIWIEGSAVGDTDPPMNFPTVAHWDGTSWTREGILGEDSSVRQVFCTGHSAVLITGGGYACVFSWNARVWDEAACGSWDSSLFDSFYSMWATDSGTGWVGGAQSVHDDEILVPQIWRYQAGVLTATVDRDFGLPGYGDNFSHLSIGGVRAIWQTSSGRTFAFGPGGLVHEYVGPR